MEAASPIKEGLPVVDPLAPQLQVAEVLPEAGANEEKHDREEDIEEDHCQERFRWRAKKAPKWWSNWA